MTSWKAAFALSGRTGRVIRQSAFGLAYRMGAIITVFAATPLMLNRLGSKEFGAWLVLLSVFQWITLFDLGVSAGARNEIARAAAIEDHDAVKKALTTGWLYVGIISLSVLLVTIAIIVVTPISSWLTMKVFDGVRVYTTLLLVLGGACLTFALNYVQSAFAALEKPSAFSIFAFGSNAIFLALLVLAPTSWSAQMPSMALIYIVSMISCNIGLYLRFRQQFPKYLPDIKFVDHSLSKSILGFGVRIFVIQLAALIIFMTSRLMTSLLLGPEQVVIYDAGFKIFSIVTMVHTLMMASLWSSFTQAYARGELDWVRRSIKQLVLLMIPIAMFCILLAVASPWFVTLWLGPRQAGAPVIYIYFAAATILSCWSNIFAYFLNGIGNTQIQFWSAIVAGAINVPATYFFVSVMGWGISGIIMGSIVSMSLFSIAGPLQVSGLIRIPKHG